MFIVGAIIILIVFFGTIWLAMFITEYLEKRKLIDENNPNFLGLCLIFFVLELAITFQLFF